MIPDVSEHQHQVAVIQWWAWVHASYGLPENLLFAIPNGGLRSAVTGRILKQEGVRSGIPDLFLAAPRGGYHGLFIEMKRMRGGSLRAGQREVLSMLTTAGYLSLVCRGAKEACDAIARYLGQSDTHVL